MSITIKEIAKLANTSRATVDRVIHNRGNVNKDLEIKIKEIIKETNFKVNEFGRGLVNYNKVYIIRVIINSTGNEFFDMVLSAIEKTSKTYRNIKLIIDELKGYNEEKQLNAIKKIQENNETNLLIITPINTTKIIDELNRLTIPIITVNNDVNINKLAFVGCDYYNSGKISGDLANLILDSQGEILIVTGSFKMLGHTQRVEGFKKGLEAASNKYLFDVIENEDDENLSYKLVKEALNKKEYDLIYFCAGGVSGGIKALEESLKNVKIITVDETKIVVKHLKKGSIVGTVTQQPYKQGSLAVNIAYEYLVYGRKPEKTLNFTSNDVKLKNSYFRAD